jgi:hypothetical protein
MQRFILTVDLIRVGPELRIAQTRCEAQQATGLRLWVSEMAEAATGNPRFESFPWTKPARALLLLLLRDLARPESERVGLLGPDGSHANSFYELVIRGKAKSGGKSWLQKMFTDPKDASERPLSTQLFRHSQTAGRFFVGLGQQWEQAKVSLRLDGKAVPPEKYAELALLVERWDAVPKRELPSAPLTATLELLVRDPATGQFTSVSEKPSLLPVKQDDELQMRVRLSRPAYLCLVWLDENGEPSPMYPWAWTSRDWNKPPVFHLLNEVTIPEKLTPAGHSDLTVGSAPGIETLILLASVELPAADTLKGLPGLLRIRRTGIKPGDLRGPVISTQPTTPTAPLSADSTRNWAIRKVTDPVEALHEALAQPLASCFECVALLTFANAGSVSGTAK